MDTLIPLLVVAGVIYAVYYFTLGNKSSAVIRDRLTEKNREEEELRLAPQVGANPIMQPDTHWSDPIGNFMAGLPGVPVFAQLFANNCRCAGYMSPVAGFVFVLIMGISGVVFMFVPLFVPKSAYEYASIPYLAPQLFPVMFLFGLLVPYYMLLRAMRLYLKRIELDLPFWLDLHCSLVEGGMGFDEAIVLICSEGDFLNRPIFKELKQVLRLINLGSNRADSLQQMADRLKVDSLNGVVSAIVQGEQLGGGMVETLRGQAEMVRNKCWEEAQHKANKLPVLLVFPMAVGVLPAMFLIVVGPPIIKLFGFMSAGPFAKKG